MHVGYLVSRYPAVSHTFVQREVTALRDLGVEVDTFSVRAGAALSEVDRVELATTTALLPPSATDLLGLAAVALRHPGATWRLVREAVAASPGGPKAALWQVFYAAEALLLGRHLRRRGITHVHAHFANVASDVARLATRFAELTGGTATWSFTMHGPTELADVKGFGLAGKVTDADLVVCISDFARSQLMALVGEEHWDKLTVVHCGIDPSRFAPVDRDRPDGAPLEVLCVGRLVPEKGQSLLVDAVDDLRRRGVDVRLTLVGDGPSRPAIEAQVTRLGLRDHVHIAGAVGQDQILDHYARADVFCLPSFAEGVPVVLMEAMATELPVLTTRITGVPELVDDGANGVLVRPGRADALADALAELAKDPDRRRELGGTGRRKVEAEFEVTRSAQLLARLFRGERASTRA
ncbi:MAG: glycosyltransferase family 4 protein [Actinomycetia bacterium]|nr:glycosyltransferase family 4 protein [Actinomycetes bacterium]